MKNKIKQLIKESNLSWKDKMEAEILFDQALRSKETQEIREIIDILEDLYRDLENSEYLSSKYQDVVIKAINEFKLRVRKND